MKNFIFLAACLVFLLCSPTFAGCVQSVQRGTVGDISTVTVSPSRTLTTVSIEAPGTVYEPDVCDNYPNFCKTFQCLDGACSELTLGNCWDIKIEKCREATFAYEVTFLSAGACP